MILHVVWCQTNGIVALLMHIQWHPGRFGMQCKEIVPWAMVHHLIRSYSDYIAVPLLIRSSQINSVSVVPGFRTENILKSLSGIKWAFVGRDICLKLIIYIMHARHDITVCVHKTKKSRLWSWLYVVQIKIERKSRNRKQVGWPTEHACCVCALCCTRCCGWRNDVTWNHAHASRRLGHLPSVEVQLPNILQQLRSAVPKGYQPIFELWKRKEIRKNLKWW